MAFVYSPATLIVLPEYFTWGAFLETTLTCALGVFMLASSVSGYLIAPMPGIFRTLIALAGVFMVAPGLESDLWAAAFAAPALVQQFIMWRAERTAEVIGT